MLAIISSVVLLFISGFIGNGWSPVFALFSVSRTRYFNKSMALFLTGKVLFDFFTGVFAFTYIVYLSYLVSYLAVRWVPSKVSCLVISATMFYFVSNTLCFVQNCTVFADCAMYAKNFLGYLDCMVAGLPYYFRSLLSGLFVYFSAHCLYFFERLFRSRLVSC